MGREVLVQVRLPLQTQVRVAFPDKEAKLRLNAANITAIIKGELRGAEEPTSRVLGHIGGFPVNVAKCDDIPKGVCKMCQQLFYHYGQQAAIFQVDCP